MKQVIEVWRFCEISFKHFFLVLAKQYEKLLLCHPTFDVLSHDPEKERPLSSPLKGEDADHCHLLSPLKENGWTGKSPFKGDLEGPGL